MENLARTAGFADPLRLQWAMEMQSTTDLNNGTLSATAELALSVVGKKGKAHKGLHACLKKHEEVAHLLDRKRETVQQLSRMRTALETSMCRGSRFTGGKSSIYWLIPCSHTP